MIPNRKTPTRRKLRKGNKTKVKGVRIGVKRLRTKDGKFAPMFKLTEKKRGRGRRKKGLTTGTVSKRIRDQGTKHVIANFNRTTRDLAKKQVSAMEGIGIKDFKPKKPVIIDNRRVTNKSSHRTNNVNLKVMYRISNAVTLGAGAVTIRSMLKRREDKKKK